MKLKKLLAATLVSALILSASVVVVADSVDQRYATDSELSNQSNSFTSSTVSYKGGWDGKLGTEDDFAVLEAGDVYQSKNLTSSGTISKVKVGVGWTGSDADVTLKIVGYNSSSGSFDNINTTSLGDITNETYVYDLSNVSNYSTFRVIFDDSGGSNGAGLQNYTVYNQNDVPVANAGNNRSVKVGDSIELNASNSSDPDGDSLTFEWSYENGTSIATGEVVNVTQKQSGNYTYSLKVTDSNGATDTDSVTVNVGANSAPQAPNLSDREVLAGQVITFDASNASDPDGDSLTFEWDFDGDGVADNTTEKPTLDLNFTGQRTITLTVSDGNLSDSVSFNLTAEDPSVAKADEFDNQTGKSHVFRAAEFVLRNSNTSTSVVHEVTVSDNSGANQTGILILLNESSPNQSVAVEDQVSDAVIVDSDGVVTELSGTWTVEEIVDRRDGTSVASVEFERVTHSEQSLSQEYSAVQELDNRVDVAIQDNEVGISLPGVGSTSVPVVVIVGLLLAIVVAFVVRER